MNAQHPIRSSPNGPQSPSITLAGGVTAIVALLLAGCNSANLGVSIQGKGDFNGVGESDILWRNTTTGDVVIWF